MYASLLSVVTDLFYVAGLAVIAVAVAVAGLLLGGGSIRHVLRSIRVFLS